MGAFAVNTHDMNTFTVYLLGPLHGYPSLATRLVPLSTRRWSQVDRSPEA